MFFTKRIAYGTSLAMHLRRDMQLSKGKGNYKMKTKLALTATAVTLSALLAPALQANDITGSIGFGSLGVNITGGTDLQSAKSFTLNSPFITTETGVYSGVPVLSPVTFNGFQFNPPVSSVTPLWTFDVGTGASTIAYSFDATSVISSYNATTREWDIGGNGIAMVTGFSATPGIWDVNLSESGASIVFDSSAAVSPGQHGIPDGGSTLMLLGSGCLGLAGFARKFNC
jgi:hypothetical protein